MCHDYLYSEIRRVGGEWMVLTMLIDHNEAPDRCELSSLHSYQIDAIYQLIQEHFMHSRLVVSTDAVEHASGQIVHMKLNLRILWDRKNNHDTVLITTRFWEGFDCAP